MVRIPTGPALALALLISGCGSASDEAPAAAPGERATPAPLPAAATPAPAATVTRAEAREERVENDLFEFEYSYPAVPEGLKSVLDKRLEEARAELEKGAREDRAEAAKVDYPYRKHSSTTTWQVVTDLPRWLSLSAEDYTYSGGAHGMTFYRGLAWDKQENRVVEPIAVFSGKPALSRAIREPFCAALDKEREKRRGEPVNRNSGDQFDECIDPAESTLILGSSNGRTFDRIGVLVEPYAAGAYAEGSFEITLPVTQAMIAAVKPQYRDSFSPKR